MKTTVKLWALGMTLLVVSPARATPLFETLGGFGGQGALQARHAGPSAASAYFNPALLTDAEAGPMAGVAVLNEKIAVHLDARLPGADVPDGLAYAKHADGTALDGVPLATDLLWNGRPTSKDGLTPALVARPRQRAGSGFQTQSYEAIGFVYKMFKERLALGMYGMVPNGKYTRLTTFFANEAEQYFSNSLHPEMYGDRLRAISIAVGTGLAITDRLSLGLGLTMGIRAVASAGAYVSDASRLQDLNLNVDAVAKLALSPQLGISWRLHTRWRLTGTVHAPQQLDVQASFKFLLATAIEQGSSLGFTFNFLPWQTGLGLSYDLVQRRELVLTATASALYARWSRYIDRQSIRPSGAYTWMDTLAGSGGLRLRSGAWSVALDGEYKPTPVPLQTGRTNYVDNDRFGLALAARYSFLLFEQRLSVGLALQSYRLIERHQRKRPTPTFADGQDRTPQLVADEVPDDATSGGKPLAGRQGLQTNNPGWPGYSSQGWVSCAGLYVTGSF